MSSVNRREFLATTAAALVPSTLLASGKSRPVSKPGAKEDTLAKPTFQFLDGNYMEVSFPSRGVRGVGYVGVPAWGLRDDSKRSCGVWIDVWHNPETRPEQKKPLPLWLGRSLVREGLGLDPPNGKPWSMPLVYAAVRSSIEEQMENWFNLDPITYTGVLNNNPKMFCFYNLHYMVASTYIWRKDEDVPLFLKMPASER